MRIRRRSKDVVHTPESGAYLHRCVYEHAPPGGWCIIKQHPADAHIVVIQWLVGEKDGCRKVYAWTL